MSHELRECACLEHEADPHQVLASTIIAAPCSG